MATTTPNLGLPRPEGSDNVTRANYVELIDTIDEKVASVSELDAHVNDKNNPHGVTPEQIGAETPEGAQAKASAAEQAAKEYTDQKIATIPPPPVTSVNNKTGAVVLTKADVGLSSVDNVKQATKAEFDAHVANTNNPHGVTKAQVGLGNVQNYGIATQAEAQAGTSNSKYMTPLRTKEAITALTGGVPFRISSGVLQYNDGSGWKAVAGFDPTSMTVNTITGYVGEITLSPRQSVDIFSLSGAGVLGQLELALLKNSGQYVGISLIVDGVEKPLYSEDGSRARTIAKTAYINAYDSTTIAMPIAIELFTPIKYSSSLVVRANNLSDGTSNTGWVIKGVYYT